MIVFADEKYKKYVNKIFSAKLKNEQLSDVKQKEHIAFYKRNRKILIFFITAAVAAITVSYNIYGLISYNKGVHGIYPYTSWLG